VATEGHLSDPASDAWARSKDMNGAQAMWLGTTSKAAEDGGHVFPTMAACEAALESAYGTSGLSRNAFNLFGMKQHQHPVYGTLNLPTKEFIHGEWITVVAHWVKYPSFAESFTDRMNTLQRLAPIKGFEHYAAALAAQDAETFVREVSAKWSTDPHRADKVLSIYQAYIGQ
jgi:flagellum-specific peptidoglycan hydrolase FlgJ